MTEVKAHPNKLSEIDNYYVRQQAKQLVSEHSQLNRSKNREGGLNLARKGIDMDDLNNMIDAEMKVSSVKKKSWKGMDMNIKWDKLSDYFATKGGIISLIDMERVKMSLQSGRLTGVEYNVKTGLVTHVII